MTLPALFMPNQQRKNAQPAYMTIAFTKEELEWLHWAVTQVLTSEDVDSTAKEKIIDAHWMFIEAQRASDAHNSDVAGS